MWPSSGAESSGAACAAQLAGADCRVVVLEQGPIGGGATAAGMGHVVVMDDSPAQLALTSYSRRLWHALVPQLPASAECDRCGTLWVAADEEEMAAVERKQAVLAKAGVATRVLSATNWRRRSRICAAAWPAVCSSPTIWSSIRRWSPSACSTRRCAAGAELLAIAGAREVAATMAACC